MHSFQLITALGALFATVAAVPVKRDTVVNTVTEIDVVTEYATETVWVDATGSPSTVLAVPTTFATTTSTYVAPIAPTTTAQPTTTQAQVAPQEVAPTPRTSTTSIYVAPPATPTTFSTSTTDTPPVTTAAPAPTSTTAAAAAPAATTTASSNSNAAVNTYSGDITYYDVGLGSCGVTNTDSDMIVAMAQSMMNKATMCGKTITISYGGETHQATVQDTCPSCASGSLDLSPALFKAVAPSGDGRVSGVEWWFN